MQLIPMQLIPSSFQNHPRHLQGSQMEASHLQNQPWHLQDLQQTAPALFQELQQSATASLHLLGETLILPAARLQVLVLDLVLQQLTWNRHTLSWRQERQVWRPKGKPSGQLGLCGFDWAPSKRQGLG